VGFYVGSTVSIFFPPLVGIHRNMEPEFKVKIPVPCEVKIPVPWGHVSGKLNVIKSCFQKLNEVSSLVVQFVCSWVRSSYFYIFIYQLQLGLCPVTVFT
jgi:hypothetical protein